jgi:hypothetical protein
MTEPYVVPPGTLSEAPLGGQVPEHPEPEEAPDFDSSEEDRDEPMTVDPTGMSGGDDKR